MAAVDTEHYRLVRFKNEKGGGDLGKFHKWIHLHLDVTHFKFEHEYLNPLSFEETLKFQIKSALQLLM